MSGTENNLHVEHGDCVSRKRFVRAVRGADGMVRFEYSDSPTFSLAVGKVRKEGLSRNRRLMWAAYWAMCLGMGAWVGFLVAK